MSYMVDRIVYVAKSGDKIIRVGFDKEQLDNDVELDQYHSGVTYDPPVVIETRVVQPLDIIKDIKQKLSPIERLILKTHKDKF